MNSLKIVDDKRNFKKKINSYLKNESLLGVDLVQFISDLKFSCYDVYVIGGFIRNVLNEDPIRDIDLMVSVNNIDEITHLFPTKSSRNRLGGYKLFFSKIQVDLWTITENWATKNKLIHSRYDLTKEIAKGVFFNFDSLVYALNANRLHCYYYNKCVETGMLDIILYNKKYIMSNPTRVANVLRAFYLNEKYGLKYSIKLAIYINNIISYYKSRHINLYKLFREYLVKYSKYSDYLNNSVLKKHIVSDYFLNGDKTESLTQNNLPFFGN